MELPFQDLEGEFKLPPGLLHSVMMAESGGDPNTPDSDKGARGLFQLMPRIATAYGADPMDPHQAARAAATLLSDNLTAAKGDVPTALAYYNYGQGNMARNGGMANLPKETTDYIGKVVGGLPKKEEHELYDKMSNEELAKLAGVTLPDTQQKSEENGIYDKMSNEELAKLAGVKLPAPEVPYGDEGPDKDPQKTAVNTYVADRAKPAPQLTADSSEDDVIRALGEDPEVIKKAPGYKKGSFDVKNIFTQPGSLMDKVGGTVVGTLIKGAKDIPAALSQLQQYVGSNYGNADPAERRLVNLAIKAEQLNYDQVQKGRKPGEEQGLGEAITEAIPSMFMPTGAVGKGVEKVLPALAKDASVFTKVPRIALPAAATGGTSAVLTTPVKDTDGTQEDFVKQKLNQAAFGAGGAAAMQPVAAEAGKLVTKGINAYKDIMPDAYKDLKALAEKHGVWDKMSYGNITQHPLPQKVEKVLENVPDSLGGMGTRVADREEAVKDAASKFTAQRFDRMVNTKFKDIDELKAAAANPGNRRNAAAKDMLDRMKNSGEDWSNVIQTSADSQLLRYRMIADKKYSKVQQLAGNAEVPVKNTLAAIKDARENIMQLKGSGRAPLLKELDVLAEDYTNPLMPNTYGALRKNATSLAQRASDAVKSNTELAGILRDVRSAVRQDLDNFGTGKSSQAFLKTTDIKQRQALQQAHREADSFYKDKVVPYTDKRVVGMLNNSEPDTIYNQFVQEGNNDRAMKLYNSLEDKGKQAIKYGMVKNALTKATNERGEFDPRLFSQEIRRVNSASTVFNKGMAKFELDGFQNLMNHFSSEAGKAEAPMGGFWALPAAAAKGGVKGVAVASGLATATRWLFTSPAGKRLMLAAGDVKPNSPAMAKIVKEIVLQAPKISGKVSAESNKGEE